jgi:hypothetical protein
MITESANSVEKSKELDVFQFELINLSEKLGNQINRLELIAIRFRGQVPDPENKNTDDLKPPHKIEELARLNNRIDRQLNKLTSLVSDLDKI